MLASVALFAASCQGFVVIRSVVPRAQPLPRATVPRANLFESLGKIVDYNKKYWSTAAAGVFDDRTARASHVLFGYNKYDDGEKRAADLKLALDSGEITFAAAAQVSSWSASPERSAVHGATQVATLRGARYTSVNLFDGAGVLDVPECGQGRRPRHLQARRHGTRVRPASGKEPRALVDE